MWPMIMFVVSEFTGIRMSHKPSMLFSLPVIIISLFFVMYTCFLVKTTLHPSSHSCGTEMREALSNLGNTCVFSVFEVRLVLENGSLPSLVAFNVPNVGVMAVDPSASCTSSRHSSSCKRK